MMQGYENWENITKRNVLLIISHMWNSDIITFNNELLKGVIDKGFQIRGEKKLLYLVNVI